MGGGGTKRAKGKKGTKKKGSKAADISAAVESAHSRIDQSKLSAKEQLFQIRFIVHKARLVQLSSIDDSLSIGERKSS